MKRWLTALGLGLALTGCGDSEPKDDARAAEEKTFVVSGTLRLTDYAGVNYEDRGKAGEACWGEKGYDDITGGAQVVVRNSKGEQVGLSRLDDGVLPEPFNRAFTCEFALSVSDIPDEGDGLYTIEVSHRGEVTFERDEADSVILTLG